MKRTLILSSAFERAAKKYLKRRPQSIKALQATLELLKLNAFDVRLKTHKLKGDLAGVWACSAEHDLRVLFEFAEVDGEEAIVLLTVGSHDEVY